MNEYEERFTIPSTPPNARKRQRRAYWPGVFAEGRAVRGEWVRTAKCFNRSTAQQVASDIRNAHRRDMKKVRVSGFLPGDVWEARWDNDPSDPDTDHFYIWLRFDGVICTPPLRDDDAAW